MEDDMQSLTENDTFTVVRLPNNQKSVRGCWVYSTKLGPDATERYKACYVAKVFGVDYHETFASTARITSIRTLTQISVQYDLIMHQMDVKIDVKTAYLNAPTDCALYMLTNLKVLRLNLLLVRN